MTDRLAPLTAEQAKELIQKASTVASFAATLLDSDEIRQYLVDLSYWDAMGPVLDATTYADPTIRRNAKEHKKLLRALLPLVEAVEELGMTPND